MASLLTADALSTLALSLLPKEGSNTLASPIEAIGLLIHAIHSSLSFRLVSPTPTAGSGESGPANSLPTGWQNGGSPKFKYRHEQSSLEFVVSVQELGGRGVITAVAVEDNKSHSFSVLLSDYLSASSFPFSPASGTFLDLFSTSARLSDLVTLYRLNVLQPLIPGLRKEGYTELPPTGSPPAGSSASGSRAPAAPIGNPRGPYFPDTGGPLGTYGGQGIGPFTPSRSPFNIGSSDLDPLGGQGGTFAGFPGAGRMGIGGGLGGEGGMMVGPNHPLFRERFGQGGVGAEGIGGVGGGGGRGLWGGDGWLPHGAVPPGARFDPIGPANGPPQPDGVGIGGFGGGQGIGNFPGARGDPGSFGPLPPGGARADGPLRGVGTRDPDWDDVRPPTGNEEWRDSMFG